MVEHGHFQLLSNQEVTAEAARYLKLAKELHVELEVKLYQEEDSVQRRFGNHAYQEERIVSLTAFSTTFWQLIASRNVDAKWRCSNS
jgi:hypothetical protein